MPLVEVSDSAGVRLIRLVDPGRRNVLSAALVDGLLAALDAAEAAADVRALVVTGAGPAFCAGADLADLLAAADGDRSGLERVYDAFLRVAATRLPTVAAVNGPAVGAGFNLALACDLRVAATSAVFDSRFLTIGIHPGGAHTWMLQRAVGDQAAAAMVLFGQRLTGAEAERQGLVWRCVPDDDLSATAMDLAATAARAPAGLAARTKETLRSVAALPDRLEALRIETEQQLASLSEPAARELIERMRRSLGGSQPPQP